MVIGIIGAGAAGMAAAISAAKNTNNQILLLERQARVGRKLLATGNGRCNLSNLHADVSGYHGEDSLFVSSAFSKFGVQNTLDWFSELGLFTITEPSGRVYPYSDQANSVVDILRFALNRDNITLYTGFEVKKARKTESGFEIIGPETLHCDKLIIACGGLAGSKLGGSMSGYQLLRSFGHKATRLRPALVQIKSSWRALPSLKGVRSNVKAQILHDDLLFAESVGELQFTEYGLSGPVIFEISRDVCQAPGRWVCRLDFLPDLPLESLMNMLKRKTALPVSCEDLLTGIVHNRLGRVLIQASGLSSQSPVGNLTEKELISVCQSVKAFDINLTEPMGMDSAQVTAGGVKTEDFCRDTMESKLVPGLFACGEVLDIDGDCGGYNLQWAWSSGRLAGESAGGIS